MDEFIKVLLSLSFSGTLLLLLLFLLKPLYKNKFSKCWQYYIWLVVALRFLLPISLDNHIMTITGYLIEKFDTIRSADDIVKTNQNEGNIEKKDNMEGIGTKAVATRNTAMQMEKLSENNLKEYNIRIVDFFISIPIYSCLFFLWLVVALVLFLRKVLLYQRFVRHIQDENIEVSEVEILNLLADCEEIVKISKPVELYHNPLIGSPIMIGFFHPKIILSTKQYNQYDKEEMFYIFLHELIHYKHGDIFYKWFIQIIICIHWFNPFVYLLGKEINRACELSCDETVISFLGDEGKSAYGDVLISALKAESAWKSPYTSVTFAKNTKQIKERLGAIMDFKKKTKLIKVITTVFTLIICICFSAVGVYASNNKTVSEQTKETKKKSREKNVFVYMRQGFFQDSYVIEMAWNINKKDKKSAADKAKITLKDKSEITIYFQKETKEYAKDKKALTAIKKIINELKGSGLYLYPVIKEPYICRIDYVPPDQISDFTEKSYKEDDLIGFAAVFPELDTKLQKRYYKKAYQQSKIEFFGCIIENMDKDTVLSYIEKAMQDEDVGAFALLFSELPSRDAKQLAKKYSKHFYKTEDFAFFSILLDYLSEKEKQKWLEQADKDGNIAFYSIISDKF